MYIGNWQILDWDNIPGFFDWVAFILGLTGIGFTLIQLLKSKGALKAAEKALNDTRDDLIANQLLYALAIFPDLSTTVDDALTMDDRESMQKALSTYCDQSVEVAALLRSSGTMHDDVAETLVNSSNSASKARAALFSEQDMSVQEIASGVAELIRDVTLTLRSKAVEIRNQPRGGSSVNN